MSVFNHEGSPLSNMVVSARPLSGVAGSSSLRAEMDQINRQFVPHFLVVQKGTYVQFPNSDSIKHHVFSFSPAKRFQLLLDKNAEQPPLLFDQAGIVELGCNVHDWMLGYIYVVDTPYFTGTNTKGNADIALPVGDFEVSVWHPRMQEAKEVLLQRVTLSQNTRLVFTLKRPLLPDYAGYESDDEFGDYE
ncbi:methylamine utilization protein [Aestuariibacter sp. A3R04]|uniref:methylamine utilization protein n=1 Tax=Aestuariibacter sp. A3R04 TaxID=2841571 RepID=UPI00352CF2B1